MVVAETTITVEPGSELDRVLTEAESAVVILIRGAERFRLSRDETRDLCASDDPERVRKALAGLAGAWTDIDAEELKADIRAQRGQDSHGRPA